MRIKLYAIMNWAEGEPKITAIGSWALVVTDRDLLIPVLEKIKVDFEALKVRYELVEFESVEVAQ